MESKYKGFPHHSNGSEIDVQGNFPMYDQYPYIENRYALEVPSPDIDFMNLPFDPPDPDLNSFDQSFALTPGGDSFVPTSAAVVPGPQGGESSDFSLGLGWSPEGDASSSLNDSDSSDPLMKFIGDILLEENMEDKPFMFDALRATEKSLYDALGEQYPSAVNSNQADNSHDSPDSCRSGSASDLAGNTSFSNNTSTSTSPTVGNGESVYPQWTGDVGGEDSSVLQAYLPNDYSNQSSLQPNLQPPESGSIGMHSVGGKLSSTSASEIVQNMFSDNESVLLFKKGLEEASKFLPNPSQLVIDLDSYKFASGRNNEDPKVALKEETFDEWSLSNGLRSRKTHGREESDLEEGRSSKQSAIGVEENVSAKYGDLSDMFDKVLLFACQGCFEPAATEQAGAGKPTLANEQTNGSKGGKARAKREGKKKESVDLRTLLILCAQATSASDFRTANELLKQIRQHSSRHGDGSQRLAHYFANGLDARLAGSTTGLQSLFDLLSVQKTTAADMLKAFQVIFSSSPFKKLSILYANKVILHASKKATTIHIVDFGILYGYQWPVLIQSLSSRPEGPPKLRITGIELPQRGFRPAERIEETGRRLAKYCKKFNVPFEYHPISEQNWENISVEALKINSNEFVAVNCLYRFKNLLDETGEGDCPRDAVLNLIRKMNPDIFVQSESNGAYNSPFFVPRFREALFHFSSFYDMFDSTIPKEHPERLTIEGEFYGLAAINAIACEGLERVERPETYKQWQVRNMRAGFKQLPLDQELVEKFRLKSKSHYHKDFVIDQDGQWLLQGWKGRILYASTCWVPA